MPQAQRQHDTVHPHDARLAMSSVALYESIKYYGICIAGDFHDASRLVDMGASITSASDAQLQAIIEQLSIPERYAPTQLNELREWD